MPKAYIDNKRSVPVTIFNKEGVSLDIPSKTLCAKVLGISVSTVFKRLKDGCPVIVEGADRPIYIKNFERKDVLWKKEH